MTFLLSTNDAHDLLVRDEEPIDRWGEAFSITWTIMGHKTGVPTSKERLREIRWWILYPGRDGWGIKSLRKKHIFFLSNDKETGPFLVQSGAIPGDSSASKVFPHKNAKPDKATVLVQSKPSQVKDWQAKVENTDAHIVYKNEVTKRTTDEYPIEQEMVGNPGMWSNFKKIDRQQRLTRDEISV